ncbi:MAG: family transposase, partial [Cyanobacteria bacterium RYN_339]|nr:family transposase [Cyanobacteria bacterium RYN_339]
MRTSQFDDSQRRFAILAVEAGWSVVAVARAFGITKMTFYRWKAAIDGELPTEGRALLAALRTGPLTSERLQAAVAELGLGEKPAQCTSEEVGNLRERLVVLAKRHPGYGYRRLHALLVAEGHAIGIVQTYRLYLDAGLAVRRERGRAARTGRIGHPVPASRPNEAWDVLIANGFTAEGRRFGAWQVSDAFTGTVLHLDVRTHWQRFTAFQVLSKLAAEHGMPNRLYVEGHNNDMHPIEGW